MDKRHRLILRQLVPALRMAKLGESRPPMTIEQALEQVIATGSDDDVREYAKQVLAAIRGEQ